MFYLSLDDDLLQLFTDVPLAWAAGRLPTAAGSRPRDTSEDDAIHLPMLSKAVAAAQRRAEQAHHTMRAQTLRFDEVIAPQRDEVYATREEILHADAGTLEQLARRRVTQALDALVDRWLPARTVDEVEAVELAGMLGDLPRLVDVDGKDGEASLRAQLTAADTREQVLAAVQTAGQRRYDRRVVEVGDEMWVMAARSMMLEIIDRRWVALLADLDRIRDAIGWRSLAQKDPVAEFTREAHGRFTRFAQQLKVDQAWALLAAPMTVNRTAGGGTPAGAATEETDGGPAGG